MSHRTSLPLHPTEGDIPNRKKKSLKAHAKAAGKPYTKYKKTGKEPGRKLSNIGLKTAAAGMAAAFVNPLLGAAMIGAGTTAAVAGAYRSESKRNKPGTTTTKTKRGGRITKTRRVTPKGVTRTKTKKYKR